MYSRGKHRHGQQLTVYTQGFTLIELVAVMLILASLGALVLPRFAHHEATLPAQADQLGRVLHQAQSLAMHQGRTLTVDIQSAYNYAVTYGGVTIRAPGGEIQSYNLVNGVTLSGPDVQYDSLGRPINAGSLISTAQTWTLTSGSNSASVSIQPLTGFVSVTP